VARLPGCMVWLCGMGGYELFAAYPRHRAAAHAGLFRGASRLARPFSGVLRRAPALQKKLDRFMRFGAIDDFGMAYTSLVGYFGAQEVSGLLGSDDGVTRFAGRIDALDRPNRSLSPLHRAMQLDRLGFLAHNLTVTDRSSMAHGVEVRVPLLTPQLGQLSAGLAPGQMIDLRHTKKPLRDVLLRHLPRSVVDRRKVGFNPPLDGRIAAIGRARLCAELDASGLPGVIDMGRVRTLVDEHFGAAANHSYRLWQLAYFGFWLQAIRTAPAHRVS